MKKLTIVAFALALMIMPTALAQQGAFNQLKVENEVHDNFDLYVHVSPGSGTNSVAVCTRPDKSSGYISATVTHTDHAAAVHSKALQLLGGLSEEQIRSKSSSFACFRMNI